MYEKNLVVDTQHIDSYFYKAQNSVGQTMVFEVYDVGDGDLFGRVFLICFYITNKKKKGFQTLRQTGKDGIKSLVWAKGCLIDFIKNKSRRGDLFIVYSDDTKRKKVYAYGLSELGFNKGKYKKSEVLMLKIK